VETGAPGGKPPEGRRGVSFLPKLSAEGVVARCRWRWWVREQSYSLGEGPGGELTLTPALRSSAARSSLVTVLLLQPVFCLGSETSASVV